MERGLVLLEDRHALLAPLDDQIDALDEGQDLAAGPLDFGVGLAGVPDHALRLLMVGGDEGHGRVAGEILDLGVDENGDALLPGKGQDLVHELLRHDPLVVVRDDDPGVGVFFQKADDPDADLVRDGLLLFLIDPHDLLVLGVDARLDRRRPGRVHEDTAPFADVALDPDSLLVVPHDADDERDRPQLGQVAADVPGPAEARGALPDLDHGHGRFGRDAGDVAPDVFVEHQVAEDEDAAVLELPDEPLHPGEVECRLGHGASFPITMGLAAIQGTPPSSGVRSRRKTSAR